MSCLEYDIDQSDASLRGLTVRGAPAVYRVFAALRDERWGTPAPRTSLVSQSPSRRAFIHDYAASGFGLTARTTISLGEHRMEYRYEAEVSEPFRRNRLGICVLLPATLAGTDVRVDHPGGSLSAIELPRRIAPHQPATDIRALRYRVGDDEIRIDFEGEVFEMEDQRNWSDFSYKIYCTPLALPFPVELASGSRIVQAVRIEAKNVATGRNAAMRRQSASSGRPADVAANEARTVRRPLIGTRLPWRIGSTQSDEFLPLDFARVDALPNAPSPVATPPSCGDAAPVLLYRWRSLPDTDSDGHADGQTHDRRRGRTDDGARGSPQVAAETTPVQVSSSCLAAGSADLLSAAVGSDPNRPRRGPLPKGMVGTDGAFAELNRERPAAGAGDIVVLTLSPQVHDRDDETVFDNLYGIRHIGASVGDLYPGRPWGIGLLELTPHFNPAAGGFFENAEIRPTDMRLQTGFGLVWCFAALCELTAAEALFVTLLESSGPYGFGGDGRLVPAAHLLWDLGLPESDRRTGVSRSSAEHGAAAAGRSGADIQLAADRSRGIRERETVHVTVPPERPGIRGIYRMWFRQADYTTVILANLGSEPVRSLVGEIATAPATPTPAAPAPATPAPATPAPATHGREPSLWDVRVIDRDEREVPRSEFATRRRRLTVQMASGDALELRPCSYAVLREARE